MVIANTNVVDPQTCAQIPIIGHFFYMFAMLFLLSVNGHYLLIDGIFHSYQFITLEGFIEINGSFSEFIIVTFNKMNSLKDRKSTRLNSSHVAISYAVFCLKKKNNKKKDNSIDNNMCLLY